MTGNVYLAGGGSAEDDQPLWRIMLPAVRRIVYWPLALPAERHTAAREWLVDSLRRFGFAAEVESWTTLRDRSPAELNGFDLLFVGGGNTFNLLQQVRANGFVEPVRNSLHLRAIQPLSAQICASPPVISSHHGGGVVG